MRKLIMVTASALALALPASANAAFIVNFNPAAVSAVPGNNNFQAALAGVGVTSFTNGGASISLSSNSVVKFEFYGKEAGFTNKFTAGSFSFTVPGGSPTIVNNFSDWAARQIGSAAFSAGSFLPVFHINGSNVLANTRNPSSADFGVSLPGAVSGSSFMSNSLFFLFDDTGAGPDDNHDDLLIRATVVPEPATWLMMIAGFGAIGLTMRRRRNYRVSFV